MGGGNIYQISKESGFSSVKVVSSKKSVEKAFAEAKSIQQALLKDKYLSAERKTIINVINEGVISIDNKHRIITINDIAKRILKIRDADVTHESIYQYMSALKPEYIDEGLGSDRAVTGYILELNSKNYTINIHPFIGTGKKPHVLITLQEVDVLQKLEAKVRKQLYMKGNVAVHQFENILGRSETIVKAVMLGRKYAATDANVLIIGETGTGKELFAQSIHNTSKRARGPFVAVSCGAIPDSLLESELFGYQEGAFTGAKKGGKKGLFELAHGGTIFLDEISELNLYGQVILLCALQEKEIRRVGGDEVIPVDVRVVAACNKSLYELVQKKEFRKDLYYRLSVLVLNIPALRDRPGDISYISKHYIEHFQSIYHKQITMQQSAFEELERFEWDGNIRQMINFSEKLVVMGDRHPFDGEFIRRELNSNFFFLTGSETVKKEKGDRNKGDEAAVMIDGVVYYEEDLRKLLSHHLGNKSKVAQILGISRTSLWRYIKKLNIKE